MLVNVAASTARVHIDVLRAIVNVDDVRMRIVVKKVLGVLEFTLEEPKSVRHFVLPLHKILLLVLTVPAVYRT
jgi:hypothetical protein